MSRRGGPSGSTACAPYKEDCTLSFTSRSRCAKQPLYRPAALRRNDAPSHIQIRKPKPISPPLTPSLSSTDLNRNWLSGLAATLSPLANPDKDFRFDTTAIKGVALPKELWKPDEEAFECDDADCTARFGLLERRHHCRRCGNVFCAAHSSRTAVLCGSSEEMASALPTPRETPRSTPRGSMLDIPSLLNNSSPLSSAFSTTSSSNNSSTPTVGSPNSKTVTAPYRVCDACYFSVPQGTTPPGSSHGHQPFVFSTNPVALRRRNASPSDSPGQSPPYESPLYAASRRSRKDSGTSSGGYGSSSAHSSPPSSLESTTATMGKSTVRGISPAASIRGTAPRTVLEEEDDEDEEVDEDEEQADNTPTKDPSVVATNPRQPTAYGSVWQVNWATF